jgi:NAD dependent epimerase/dehydratase family enzyme
VSLRVVVVGATGQIGRTLCHALIGAGHAVIVFSRDPARVLGQAAGHRAWLPVPSPLARMGLGVVTDILIGRKRVVPARASALGYRFRFPVPDAALRDLLAQPALTTTVAR